MTPELKYPLGIQTFSKIRQSNYLYIDKTKLLHELISKGEVYFLSRPRRFGKSLLISTLESLFLGERELFEGLNITTTDYEFTRHPVIKLEFSKDEFISADTLREFIYSSISRIAKQQAIELEETTYNQRFDELIVKLHQKSGQKVVLLIDEYDKPILNNLNKPALSEIKQVMNTFYSVAKSVDEHLRFVFITGVSKFAKVSVFSGMNNLTDISMDREYSALCGITQQELESNFSNAITQLSQQEKLEPTKLLAKIKQWYNGYHFEENATSVYNPYSLLSLFSKGKFKNYWFTTATPTFLLDLIQQRQYELKNLTELKVGEAAFEACEPEEIGVQSVFLQTGYLTIKNFNEPLYQLDFPNFEVKKSFYDAVTTRFANLDKGVGESYTAALLGYLQTNQLNDFFETLKVFFANIPYTITLKDEKYYQSLLYAVFCLLGLNIKAEVSTNKGRIDCVIETSSHIYIIEFKVNETKEAALKQIQNNEYAQKYQLSEKEIVLIGVEFDQGERNIGGWVSEENNVI